MNRKLAVDILKAIACCSITELHCSDCPLYEEEPGKCIPWRDDEAVEAVRLLNKEESK